MHDIYVLEVALLVYQGAFSAGNILQACMHIHTDAQGDKHTIHTHSLTLSAHIRAHTNKIAHIHTHTHTHHTHTHILLVNFNVLKL